MDTVNDLVLTIVDQAGTIRRMGVALDERDQQIAGLVQANGELQKQLADTRTNIEQSKAERAVADEIAAAAPRAAEPDVAEPPVEGKKSR